MNGIYKFYQNGKLIAEAKNSLTETGRILAIKTLMGALPSFGNSLSVGVSNIANSGSPLITDKNLSYRVSSSPVYATNLDTTVTNDAIVFKAKLSDPLAYRIYEVGLFSDQLLNGNSTDKHDGLLAIESSDNLSRTVAIGGVTSTYTIDSSEYLAAYPSASRFYVYGTDSSNFRIGNKALLLKAGENVFTTNPVSGLDQYAPSDLIKIAYYVGSGSTDSTVSVEFTSNSATRTFTFTEASDVAVYNIASKKISEATSGGTGAFSWNQIDKIKITAATKDYIIDGIRFEKAVLTDTNSGMISRAVLSTPITKAENTEIDIEYYLTLGFNV